MIYVFNNVCGETVIIRAKSEEEALQILHKDNQHMKIEFLKKKLMGDFSSEGESCTLLTYMD